MMRAITILAIGGGLLLAAGAAANPESGTVQYRATATFSDGSSADRLYAVRLDADSDGDGVGDETWLRVRCDKGAMAAVYHTIKSPRDSASGMASGKRQHKPFTIIKEWDAKSGGSAAGMKASWDLATAKGGRSAVKPTYNVKENKGARVDHTGASDASAGKGADGKTMGHDDWHEVALTGGSPNLCA